MSIYDQSRSFCYDLTMKKPLDFPVPIKAERREQKKRPRMKVSGASLRNPNKHAGMKLAKVKK